MSELAKKADCSAYKTYTSGKDLIHYQGTQDKLGNMELPGKESVAEAYLEAIESLEQMAETVDPTSPWSTKHAESWDQRTVQDWLETNVMNDYARWLIETGLRTVLATELYEVSLLHLLFYARSSGGVQYLMDNVGGAQDEQLLEGTQHVVDWLVEQINDSIRTNCTVERIQQNNESVRMSGDKFQVEAKYGLVAIPPTLAGRIEYDPPLPGRRDQLTQRTPAGSIIKFHVIYNEPFWRSEDLSGMALTDCGPFRVIFDGGPGDSDLGFLVGFMEGREAREANLKSEGERRNTILDSLTTLFGSRAAESREYRDKDWMEEPYTRGCYGAYFPPGTWTSHGSALRKPIGRLHWAGTETATKYAGYMEGAVRSGERAAREIMERF
jgi:monoamine oxidase